MWDALRHPTFARLFAAQAVALLGTGLATVALALLAYELAPASAGSVLGTALGLKMIAYVGVAPLAGAALQGRSPRRVLVALDLVRGGAALLLPFVEAVWQVYALIFVLQAASAAFTPVFQAAIPAILKDERTYTGALSLARLAQDLEAMASPALAALLLTMVGFHDLFGGTAIGFAASALLIAATRFPAEAGAEPQARASFKARLARGLLIYARTPRLRGLVMLHLAIAASGAMVLVNTVVYVRAGLGLGERETALAMAAYGAGSMAAALLLPRLLDRLPDRPLMLGAAAAMGALLALGALLPPSLVAYGGLLVLLGASYALAAVPTGRIVRRSAAEEDHVPAFAAQFTLSHAMWLIAYPLAGWLGAAVGLDLAFVLMGGLGLAAAVLAARLWPAHEPAAAAHVHLDLAPDDTHASGGAWTAEGYRHAHAPIVDARHATWPDGAAVRRL